VCHARRRVAAWRALWPLSTGPAETEDVRQPLTDTAVRSAKRRAKGFKLFDGGGLYLEVNPAGGEGWRWKPRSGGKENRLSLRLYPDVTLKAARKKRDAARRQLADGIDP